MSGEGTGVDRLTKDLWIQRLRVVLQRTSAQPFTLRALLLGEWVNEARETAFLEDRSVNAWFYGA